MKAERPRGTEVEHDGSVVPMQWPNPDDKRLRFRVECEAVVFIHCLCPGCCKPNLETTRHVKVRPLLRNAAVAYPDLAFWLRFRNSGSHDVVAGTPMHGSLSLLAVTAQLFNGCKASEMVDSASSHRAPLR